MEFKLYKCETCGNVAMKIFDQGPDLVCCGDVMKELKAGTTDAAQEKHVPAIKREGNHIDVVVGSTPHPMEEKHWITFIAAIQGNKLQIKHLTPDDEPKASFDISDGKVSVYEYCNLHGLWKAEA